MADDNSDKPAEWHAKQAAQYKAELDQLNPKLNAAESMIAELEIGLREARELGKSKAAALANSQAEVNRLDGQLTQANAHSEQLAKELSSVLAELKAANTLSAKRAAVLKQVGAIVQPVMAALVDGLTE